MRWPFIALWLVFEAGMLSVFFLYEIDITPFLHLSVIFFVMLILIGAFDFFNQNRVHKLLIEKHVDMVTPSNFIEEDYRNIIEDLELLNRRIRDKATGDYNDMIDYFTVWAHQIKTPLAGLSLTIQNIEDDGLRQTLQAELVRTEEYADMVLNYLRLQDDSSDYLFEEFKAADVIKQEIRRMRTLFFSKKISVDFETNDTVILSDKRWLGFVIGQIFANSVKYSNGGTVTIRVDSNEITIKDEGIGISKEDLPRIFEKGYTGYNGRSDKKSTGIGLYLVKKAMTAIGGDITIESEEGKGTTAHLIVKS